MSETPGFDDALVEPDDPALDDEPAIDEELDEDLDPDLAPDTSEAELGLTDPD